MSRSSPLDGKIVFRATGLRFEIRLGARAPMAPLMGEGMADGGAR